MGAEAAFFTSSQHHSQHSANTKILATPHCRKTDLEKTAHTTSNLESSARPVNQSLFKCGCCMGKYEFKKSIACRNGHLFCQDCIKILVKNISYDARKSSLPCPHSSCNAAFSSRKLDFIKPQVIEKTEEQQQK